MIFTQYYLDCLSQASYLIGDPESGRAVVVGSVVGHEAEVADIVGGYGAWTDHHAAAASA